MPPKNPDLHGNVPDSSPVALLLIDVINDLEFPGGEILLPYAEAMAEHLSALKRRVEAAGIPCVYVNDNFGRWRSDFNAQVNHCLDEPVRGQSIAHQLRPGPNDYFVLKPKHSGFFSSSLGILLDYLKVETLILSGIAGNNCVLFTANDAYMRDYRLVIPRDCVASNTDSENQHALRQMATILKADTRPSTELNLEDFVKAERRS